MYDSTNRVLVTLLLSDLQGYEDALPLSLLVSPRLILVTRRKILNYCYVPQHRHPEMYYEGVLKGARLCGGRVCEGCNF